MKKNLDLTNGLNTDTYCYIGTILNQKTKPGHFRFKIGVAEYSNSSDREQKLSCGGGDWDYTHIAALGCCEFHPNEIEKKCKALFANFIAKRKRIMFGVPNTESIELPIEYFDEVIKMFNFIPATDENIANHPLLEDFKAARIFFTNNPLQYVGPVLKEKKKITNELDNRKKDSGVFGNETVSINPQRLGGIGREEDVLKNELQDKNPYIKLFKEKEEKDLSGKEK